MIQGIDAGALINAYRQGQSDRAAQAKARLDQQRQQQIGGLMGQLFGGGEQAPQTSLSSQASQPNGIVATPGQQAETSAMEARFPGAPSAAPTQPQRRPDPNVLSKLIVLDPEVGGKIASAFKTMGEADLKRAEAKNTMMASAAHVLSQLPEDQRPQFLQSIAGQLQEVGFTPEELSRADLSNNGLRMMQATGIDVDKMIDNELAEREFQAGKVVSVAPGGMAVRIRPEGNNEVVIAPGVSPTPNTSQVSGIPQGAIDYLRSNPSLAAQFDQKYGAGASAQFLGGGASNGTGGFPGD